jgi:curved DNA-binding protein CbpA
LQHPGTPRAGHKPKEPDAHKTARQGVQQEAAQELVQEINEAYGVLSDPDRRRALDRDFGGPERVPEVPVQPPNWPIAPEPISLFGQPEQTKPSFDAFRERAISVTSLARMCPRPSGRKV